MKTKLAFTFSASCLLFAAVLAAWPEIAKGLVQSIGGIAGIIP